MREIIPNKDDMTIAKLLTHGGKNVTLYCVAKNPVLFEFDQYLIPTGRQRLYIKSAVIKFVNLVINVFSCFVIVYVFFFCLVYTLWKHPNLLPVLTTWPPVLQKISQGAGNEIAL